MGHRQAKLNRHNFSGIFLGYTATDDNIRYIESTLGLWKRCTMSCSMRPGTSKAHDHQCHTSCMTWVWRLMWPRLTPHRLVLFLCQYTRIQRSHSLCLNCHPGQKYTTTSTNLCYNRQQPPAAAAAKMQMNKVACPHEWVLDYQDCMAQIYLSPTPFNDAFEEILDLSIWHNHDHPTIGMWFIHDDVRLYLVAMMPSTTAAKIRWWHSRMKGASIMKALVGRYTWYRISMML